MLRRLCGSLRTRCKDDKNTRLRVLAVLGLFFLGLGILVFDLIRANTETDGKLLRNTYGQGTREETLRAKTPEEETNLRVEVSERLYEGEEVTSMFSRCIRQLEKEIPGENSSLERVEKDLVLCTTLPGYPVTIDWELDGYEVMNITGELREENLKKEGTLVHLTATLTYTQDESRQAQNTWTAVVYPKTLTGTERFSEELARAVKEEDERTQKKEQLSLPKTIGEKQVQYYPLMQERGPVLLLMAVIIGLLFVALEKQKEDEERKNREEALLLDYPEIIGKLTLLLGAGMTVKRSFRKIVEDYEREKADWGTRPAYEEMKLACKEMENGYTESESYERYGKRCQIPPYRKLGALLSQNLRKGTKGLRSLLEQEAEQAVLDRKARARQLGEEAGTKLLLPMFLMLAVVLVMVMVPAFLSIRL